CPDRAPYAGGMRARDAIAALP
ncbi:MAG: hypothetical protein QOI73_2411, partial [Solirubrobacteraceae bacterium]|nr:hypothetical protein [Solirubrobacteraceae bacterium]